VSVFVDSHRDRFGVEPICREIEASASAYRARRTRPPSRRAVRDAWLLAQIRRVHAGSDGVYGQLKIWDELNEEGIAVARCTIERLMRKNGIEGVRNGKVQVTTRPGLAPIAAPDLVRRDFTADRPDAVWLSDFTYIRTWEGWSYLAVVLDIHTRRIVGWQLASHMRQSLVTDAFDMALASRREHEDGLIAHSDNGSPVHVLRIHRATGEGRHRSEQGPDGHRLGRDGRKHHVHTQA
jgi:putative transposase